MEAAVKWKLHYKKESGPKKLNEAVSILDGNETCEVVIHGYDTFVDTSFFLNFFYYVVHNKCR